MKTTTKTTKTTKRRNTFSRIAGSTYACDCCGRQTRNTGAQALGSKTCPQCRELAGIENEISDGICTLADRREFIDQMLSEIRAKGGNPDESFSSLLADAPTATVEPQQPTTTTEPTSKELADANRRAVDPTNFERLAALKAQQPTTTANGVKVTTDGITLYPVTRNGRTIYVTVPENDDDFDTNDAESWIVRCRVSGGISGTRESVLKNRDGSVQHFGSEADAKTEAVRLATRNNVGGAFFQYWPDRA